MFNFRIEPINARTEEEKIQKEQMLQKERERIISDNKKKAIANSMQTNVLGQLASTLPTNPNANMPSSQNVEQKIGW